MTDVDTQYRDSGIGAPGEQRREFVRAFTEHGWARPGTERPAARPHVTLIVATVATLLAVLAGVAMQLIKPIDLHPDKTVAAPVTTAPTWTSVAGWDCAAATDHGFDASGRQSTWQTIGAGGYAQDGCHGDYEAIPYTATATTATPPTVQWWFQPASMKQCAVQVYVPVPSGFTLPGSVSYSVLDAHDGTAFARFTIAPAGHAGRWVTAGTYPVGTGIAVQLSSAGKAPSKKAMLAVAQVKVGCTG